MLANISKKVKATALMLLVFVWAAAFSANPAIADSTSKGTGIFNSIGTIISSAKVLDTNGNVMTDSNGNEIDIRRLQKTVDSKPYDINNSAVFKAGEMDKWQKAGQAIKDLFSFDANELASMGEYYKENDVGILRQMGDFNEMMWNKLGNLKDAAEDAVLSTVDKWAESNTIGGVVTRYTLKPLAHVTTFIADIGFGIVKFVGTVFAPTSNVQCRQERMDVIYKSGCYPCRVIKSLLSAFVNGVNVLENVMTSAGKKILLLCFMLWVVFYFLQQLSSLKNLEPAAMINDLLIMAFKVLGAWLVISVGFTIFVNFVIVPFLGWGIDFGTYILTATASATGLDISQNQVASEYLMTEGAHTLTGQSYFPPHLMNNLMTYVAAVDGTVTSHMKLGHMLTCHALHKGKLVFAGILNFNNIFIWICGAAIWFLGLMMTFSVLFYLIDISFKVGFSIIAFPITMALWPFSLTTDKIKGIVKMIINGAGIFVFLAMTTSMGLALVSAALSIEDITSTGEAVGEGLKGLFKAIESGDNDAISKRFSLFSTPFLVLIVAYLYAFKSIGSTKQDYVDHFFPDSVLGDQSPMHRMLVGAVGIVGDRVKGGLGVAKDIVKHQSSLGFGKMMNAVGTKEGREGLRQKFESSSKNIDKLKEGKIDELNKEEEKKSGADTAKSMTRMESKDTEQMKNEGKSKQGAEKAAEAIEKSSDAAGEALSKSGEAVKNSAKASAQAQQGIGQAAGAGLDATVVGAPAGVAVQASTQASATATEVAGQVAGETMKIAGKVAKETGKVAGKVAKETAKVTENVKKAGEKAAKAMEGGSEKGEKGHNSDEQNNNGNKQNNGEGGNSGGKRDDDFNTTVARGAAEGALGGKEKK